MSSPVVESWIFATMLIENDWRENGTGFLVFRATDENNNGRVFLVTNKHVLNDTLALRNEVSEIKVYFNYRNEDEDGEITGGEATILLDASDGLKIWREHPDNDVDVLAIDVSPLLCEYPHIERQWASYDKFVTPGLLSELDITAGDDVMVIGYPLGLSHRITNYPLLRTGMISTRIGETLEEELTDNGITRKRILRGFLIDGGTVPGSSGSPVVLKPIAGRYVNGEIDHGMPEAILLGIIAETKHARIDQHREGFAGLGLAFDAETIKETIELFFQ